MSQHNIHRPDESKTYIYTGQMSKRHIYTGQMNQSLLSSPSLLRRISLFVGQLFRIILTLLFRRPALLSFSVTLGRRQRVHVSPTPPYILNEGSTTTLVLAEGKGEHRMPRNRDRSWRGNCSSAAIGWGQVVLMDWCQDAQGRRQCLCLAHTYQPARQYWVCQLWGRRGKVQRWFLLPPSVLESFRLFVGQLFRFKSNL